MTSSRRTLAAILAVSLPVVILAPLAQADDTLKTGKIVLDGKALETTRKVGQPIVLGGQKPLSAPTYQAPKLVIGGQQTETPSQNRPYAGPEFGTTAPQTTPQQPTRVLTQPPKGLFGEMPAKTADTKEETSPYRINVPYEFGRLKDVRLDPNIQYNKNAEDAPIAQQAAGKKKAWIYQHKRLGTFRYCDRDQGVTVDFNFLGIGVHPNPQRCALAQAGNNKNKFNKVNIAVKRKKPAANRKPPKGKDAWIYQHKRLGTIRYCDADQGVTVDYTFLGTGKHPNPQRCFLAQWNNGKKIVVLPPPRKKPKAPNPNNVAKVKGKKAWIYQNLRSGKFIYCDSDQGNPRDFAFIGMTVRKDADRCFLAQ